VCVRKDRADTAGILNLTVRQSCAGEVRIVETCSTQ
jgi:hypothetical protein